MTMTLLLAAFTVFQVDPWSNVPFLPDADPEGGVATETLSFAAAKGEIEAVSFVVRPDGDATKVDVVLSDLTGPDGAKIPAAAADVSLVKVWFRPGGRWNSSWKASQTKPMPISGLILHDDGLVKVDWEKKINYLRGDYPDGPSYMDISRRDIDTHFKDNLEPIHDAPKFVPFDLKRDFRQQYLVTWRVPKDTKPGAYAGTIALVPAGAPALKTLKVALEVRPFVLPRPRTHYDTSEPYMSMWIGAPTLKTLLGEGCRLDRAERKLRAVFRSMAEHNAVNLGSVGDLQTDSTDDYALRTLLIARQEGLCANPLVSGPSYDATRLSFVWAPGSRPEEMPTPEKDPDLYRKSLADYRAFVTRQNAIMDKYLGHHNCYYSSVDECSHRVNRRSYGYWDIVHELGGRVWTDSAKADYNGAFVDINDVAALVDHRAAWTWREGGAKTVTYAATFTGPENPDLWRRLKGIRFWYADFDGHHEYCFFDGRYNRWNDFVYRDRYCQFGIVYLTDEGLISTLAWEALREALDDVRYFSLLRLRAEAALRSSDPETRALGRKALVWQDGVDPEYVTDLNAFRRETAAWIERLIARIGLQPEDKETELPPPAELPPDGRWQQLPEPSAGAAAVFAYVEKMSGTSGGLKHGENRYDLALVALDRLLGDEKASVSDRVRAAVRASELHSELQERGAAVGVVDRALGLKGLQEADRGRLYLRRVQALMTDARYQEAYGVRQLDEASKALEQALAFSGVSEKERYEAIEKMTAGYLAAREYGKCAAFVEARLKDVKLAPKRQAHLCVLAGNAWKGLGEWKKALKSYDEAHRRNNNDKDVDFRKEILQTEAEVAEQAKDYARAVSCWQDLIPIYNPIDDKEQIDRAKREVQRLQPLARKSAKPATGALDEDDGEAISLDE